MKDKIRLDCGWKSLCFVVDAFFKIIIQVFCNFYTLKSNVFALKFEKNKFLGNLVDFLQNVWKVYFSYLN